MARRPYTGRTTSPYGPRLAPIFGASTLHAGVDGVGGYNTAPEGGGLIGYGYAGGWGNRIVFQGDSGVVHYLAHNAPGGLLVPVGHWYPEGTPLGIKGMTGTATGVHVHWETRPGGGATIDPQDWLTSAAGGDITPIEEDDMYSDTDRGRDNTVAALVEQIDKTTQDIQKRVMAIAKGDIMFPGADYPAFNAIAGETHEILTALRSAGFEVDLDALSEKLAAEVEANAEQRQAELLAAIAGVDEATLATFGLQRTTAQ